MKVRRLDPIRADGPQSSAIRAAIDRVISSGCFVGGPEVEALERELAARLEAPAVVTCASGTDALTLALDGLKAIGLLAAEGTVVLPALSFSATASAVVRAGLRPVFVDVDPDTLLIDWTAAAAVPDPIAVMPVHLYGRVARPPSGWDGPLVIEDACQAFGAGGAGSLGAAAAFSFFPSKPLGCYGDGGAVACSPYVADHLRSLARHGVEDRKYVSVKVGFNSRLDAVQAAILRAKLPAVEDHRRKREQIARTYQDQLDRVSWLRLPEFVPGHAWHCYVVRVTDGSRDGGFLPHLRECGVDAVVQYPVPLHRMRAFAQQEQAKLPHAEMACEQLVCLPIWSGMTSDEIGFVVDAVRSY